MLVCEVIDKTLVGFKYVYLMVPLSKYIFISSSFCVCFFFLISFIYVISGTGDLLKTKEELCCHAKLCHLTEKCF